MEIERSVMFKLVVEYRECLVFLLIYKIFKRGFLHDSKHADIPSRVKTVALCDKPSV